MSTLRNKSWNGIKREKDLWGSLWIIKGRRRRSLTPVKGEGRTGLGRKSLRQQHSPKNILGRPLGSPWTKATPQGSWPSCSLIVAPPHSFIYRLGRAGRAWPQQKHSSGSNGAAAGVHSQRYFPQVWIWVMHFHCHRSPFVSLHAFLLMFGGHRNHKCFHVTKFYLDIWCCHESCYY